MDASDLGIIAVFVFFGGMLLVVVGVLALIAEEYRWQQRKSQGTFPFEPCSECHKGGGRTVWVSKYESVNLCQAHWHRLMLSRSALKEVDDDY